MNPTNTKIGILGGGQLGKMLALAAHNLDIPVSFLDVSRHYPAGQVCPDFREGYFSRYEDVYQFGKQNDLVTIEIEHVNTAALLQLKNEGITVHPDPEMLKIIQDKGLQKEFYKKNSLPSAPFQIFENEQSIRETLQKGGLKYPFVQKTRTAGYDGRGVAVIRSESDWSAKILKGPSVVEEMVDIQKEIAVIVARNESGEIKAFPAVEMVFNPDANLVEFLNCPAQIDPSKTAQAEELAMDVIQTFNLCGLLAVEMFLTTDGRLLINEVAPRPHNSGHHTIDSCFTSQFEQHLRAILNLPLGSTRLKMPSVMINLLGEPGHSGPVFYEGLDKCLAMEGVKVHLYGKHETRPFRKMGHVTILDDNTDTALQKAMFVKNTLRVKSYP